MNPSDERSPGGLIANCFRHGAQRLRAIWDRVIYPLEYAAAWVVGKALAADDRLESTDVFVVSLLRLLLVPIRLVAWPLNCLLSHPLVARLRAAFNRLGVALWYASAKTMRLAECLNFDLACFWLVRKTRYLWQPPVAVLGFMVAWCVSRSSRELAFALPALLLLVALTTVGYRAATADRTHLIAHYRAALAESTDRHDQPAIDLCERRLVQWGASTDRHHYVRGLALAAEGRLAEAREVMERLAPLDKPGYFPARLWVAQHAFTGQLELTETERRRVIDGHLGQLEERLLSHDDVQHLLGWWQLEQKEFSKAAETLRPLMTRSCGAACQVLLLDIADQRHHELLRDADVVIAHLVELKNESRLIGGFEYKAWALALEIKRDDNALERVLLEWNAAYPLDQQAKAAFRRFAEQRIEALLAKGITSPAKTAKLLNQAGDSGSSQKWLDQQIERLYHLRDHSVVATPLPEQVLQLLLEGEHTSEKVLQALGTQAALSSEWERALGCFRRVTLTDPQSAVAWNNLAWVLAHQDRPDLSAALEAAQRAVALAPGEYEFRETRGQIWLELGRFSEAIIDLEYARQGLPPSPDLEAALGAAYAAQNSDGRSY